jgi:hypothetical protein
MTGLASGLTGRILDSSIVEDEQGRRCPVLGVRSGVGENTFPRIHDMELYSVWNRTD